MEEEKLVYTDGCTLCVWENGQTKKAESEYILRYKETARRQIKNNEWKKNGQEALLQSNAVQKQEQKINAYLNGVAFTGKNNNIVYSFSVNESSGLYYKDIEDEKGIEAHILTSNQKEYADFCYNTENSTMICTVGEENRQAHLVFFDKNGEDKTITDGDCFDENPSFSPIEPNVVFYDSMGIGRDSSDCFVQYGEAKLYSLNLSSLQTQEIKTQENILTVNLNKTNKVIYMQ